MLTPNVGAPGRDAGDFEQVDGRQPVRRSGARGRGPLLLLPLHGFPSSSYDWRRLLALRPGRAALAFDFLGFGLSEKPGEHEYTLAGRPMQRRSWCGGRARRPVFVVAHDMGTSVATELFARDLRGARSGFDPLARSCSTARSRSTCSSPTIGAAAAAQPARPAVRAVDQERSFRAHFARIFSDAHLLTAEEAADQWALLAHNEGHRIAHLHHPLHGGARTLHRALARGDSRLARTTHAWPGACRTRSPGSRCCDGLAGAAPRRGDDRAPRRSPTTRRSNSPKRSPPRWTRRSDHRLDVEDGRPVERL